MAQLNKSNRMQRLLTLAGAALTVAALLAVAIWLTPAIPAHTASGPPSRIVSLVPSVTEMLFAIGAGPRVVAVSSFDHEPPVVERLPRVGALLDPDVERILSMRPDLVIVYASQVELIARFQRAGIGVFSYRHGSLNGIFETMRVLGTRLGLEANAAKISGALAQRLDEICVRAKGRPNPRTLLIIGREPQALRGMIASGGIGFLHDLLEVAGGNNVFADVRRESLNVSTEMILARAPEVIIELHATDPMTPAQLAREQAAWSILSAVPAVRDHRVILLFGGELVVPGPRVSKTALAFARALEFPRHRD